MAEIRKRIVFHGRVQGVGFRYTAKYLAQSLELTGWVRNDWDQTVTMEVQGREALINKLLVGLNQGRFIDIQWMVSCLVQIMLKLPLRRNYFLNSIYIP